MSSYTHEIGYFGNIWVRSHYFAKSGETNGNGHTHHFDHVTLLAQGTVKVEVEDSVKEFTGPTFIVIQKDKKHKFTSISDNVIYYCVFALRDVDGNVTDIYSGDNSPYGSADDDHTTVKQLQDLDKNTTNEL